MESIESTIVNSKASFLNSDILQYVLIGVIILGVILYAIYIYIIKPKVCLPENIDAFVNTTNLENNQQNKNQPQVNNLQNNTDDLKNVDLQVANNNLQSSDLNVANNNDDNHTDNNNKLYSKNDSLPSDTELLEQYNLSANEIENIKNRLDNVE
jgi:hypothetical protein